MSEPRRFWLLAVIGCLALGVLVLLLDLPAAIARGENGRLAIQLLDAMRRPLLAIEAAETRLFTPDAGAAVGEFDAAAAEAEQLLAHYRELARYNPELQRQVEVLTGHYREWIATERHLFGHRAQPPAAPDSALTAHTARHLLVGETQFLNVMHALGEGEHPIHADIAQGKQALITLLALVAALFCYLGGLMLWQRSARARELERLRTEIEASARGLADANARLRQETAAVQLLQAVTAAANKAKTVEEALLTAIRHVCSHTGWPVGHAYLLSRDVPDTLVPAGLWYVDDPARHHAFCELTEATHFPAGRGLPGRVLKGRVAAWIIDVTRDQNFPRAKAAESCGLRAGFAFPVLVGSKVAAVLEFYATAACAPDAELLELMTHVGTQLGRVIERTDAEEHRQRLVHYDQLTGLPNRALFTDRLSQAIARARRHGRRVAVLYLDLDRFKGVNDTLGHDTGDTLLQAVAQRLLGVVRAGDTVARAGGDEFVIIYEDVADDQDIPKMAEDVLEVLVRPFVIRDEELFVSASIGISAFPRDSEDARTLLKCADIAMYRAKERGKNNFQFYSPALGERASRRLTLETQLRHALEREEFVLHYQPKVSLDSGVITGAEALVRWRHPELGLVEPSDFVPVLDETGLIVPVGAWILREACAQAATWERNGWVLPHTAVNLSARQFMHRDLIKTVTEVLRDTGLDPRRLELEITESVLMAHETSLIAALQRLDAMGIRLVVDDFGTGYSSLHYLRRFPIRAVKIDRSFVQDMTHDPDDATITRTVIAMAHSLRMITIAEGVETAEQLEFLRAHQCDELQGFYFSRPLPAEEFEQLLREDRRLAVPEGPPERVRAPGHGH